MRSYFSFVVIVLALLAAACGANNPLTAAGAAPTSLAADDGGAIGRISSLAFTPGVNSCPDGELVSGITVNVTNGGTAIVQWTPVGSIHEYVITLTRYQSGEQIARFTVKDRELVKIGPMSDSTYRVYVSYQNVCGGYGPQGNGVVFSVDGGAVSSAGGSGNAGDDVIVPDTDTPDGNGGSGETPGGGIDLPGDGGSGGNGGNDACHVHKAANDHGTPSGDHNDDGHHDCGIGK